MESGVESGVESGMLTVKVTKKLQDQTVSYEVAGSIRDTVTIQRLSYLASAPRQHITSWSGSGLPFANPLQAFQNTPNSGVVDLDKGNRFVFHVECPNSFYTGLGKTLIPPTAYMYYSSSDGTLKTAFVKLDDSVPFRTLTHPPERTSVLFYENVYRLPVRNQEDILLSGKYPWDESHRPEITSFWGLRPSM
jgi:hypothetical protein